MGLNDDLQWVGSGDIQLPELSDEARFPVTPVRAATAAGLSNNTTAGLIMTCDSNQSLNDHTIDGLSNFAVGELLLVKNETSNEFNGVYEVLTLGNSNTPWQLKRTGGWDTSDEVKSGRLVTVSEGTANADSEWQLTTNDPITLGTSDLAFAKVGASQITTLSANLASNATGYGAKLIGIEDSGGLITATTVEMALAENRTAIDANTTSNASNAANIALHTTAISNLQTKMFQVTLANTTQADISAAATSNEVALTGAIPTGASILGGTYTLPHGFSNASKADTAITMNIGWNKKNAAIASAIDISEDATGISSNPVSMLITPMAVSNGVTALKATFNSASNISVLNSGLVSATLLCCAPVADS